MMFSNYCRAVAGKSIFIRGHFRPILQAMQRHSESLAFGQLGRAVFRQGLGLFGQSARGRSIGVSCHSHMRTFSFRRPRFIPIHGHVGSVT